MLRLAVRSEEEHLHFEVPLEEALLGTSGAADLCAPFRGISRRHALLSRHPRGVLVVDAGSKNGLVRNGKRYDELVLEPGDTVSLGQATLTLEEISTADADVMLPLDSIPDDAGLSLDDTQDTSSQLEHQGGGSAAAALAWTRELNHHDRTVLPTAVQIDAAREALGASSLLVVELPDPSRGGSIGIRLTSGDVPSEDDLARLAHRFGARGSEKRGGSDKPTGETSLTSLVDRPALVRCCSREPHRRLIVATLEGEARKPRAWQIDFFDYLADALLPAAGGAADDPRGKRSGSEAAELVFPPEFVQGSSTAMARLLGQIRATVRSNLDVLLLGDTGTGKELFAKMIHASGPTPSGPFVAINCAAIPAELLEAQLFGVEGRIATGVDPRVGLFVKAEGGSIFLDEIGELTPALQAKLLRVIQEREVLPIGAHAPRKIRLRVISASNKNLEREVRHERFRADLYYRLRGLQFHLPPLRDRPEDIPALVARFVAQTAAAQKKRIAGVSRKALELLAEYDWPGNVRELRSEIDRAVLLASGGEPLTSEHFGGVRWHLERRGRESGDVVLPSSAAAAQEPSIPEKRSDGDELDLATARDELETRLIEEALRATGGNKSRAAKRLGITRNGLALKMKRLGIEVLRR
jgi:DNA-binding NtrC family response regulator